MKEIVLNGKDLTLESLIRITRNGAQVCASLEAMEDVKKSRALVEELVAGGRPMYGINTGFGRFSEVAIPEEDINLLQIKLILADAAGVGAPLPTDVVRGMLVMRANSLLNGFSGVRPVVINTILDMLNRGVHPVVPEKGSVGSSGDLCPLAHMVLPMIGLGEAEYNGVVMEGAEAMAKAKIPLIELKAKEGLALINGTQCMTSVAAHALADAITLKKTADIVGALTVESLRGIKNAYDPRIQDVRRHSGQREAAENMLRLLEGSEYVTTQGELRMQDSYSLRCIPQIHGASRLAIDYVASVVENEINAVTDNPIVLVDTGDVFSGGNFHGQPVAIAADTLGIALSELGNISERRIAKLIDPALNHGLPAFLVKHGGINCGFMIPQYAAAALVSENKVLAHPASVDSIPTSAGQEDHVSMGTIGARKAAQILENVRMVLGIELMCAAQALDLQEKRKLGAGTEAAYKVIRGAVEFMEEDRVFYKDQKLAAELIADGTLVKAVEEAVGTLR
ncbi:histidine ammonia-lyase [Cloacibacillus porcorum]|uniref:histidine ammonia-lyase n=1 Tax=Cloacibacillus porcorum TaxID=1197717 RepID=UPI0014594A3C|nr:histidine ammonia-lyase [Cloacibacillus porcorum]MCC8184792.1 histidine ammonia-lyase [Cloacibacillus porcorum]NMF19444.1 histidine ammonia-lyase [Cloacibacillus porcorum]